MRILFAIGLTVALAGNALVVLEQLRQDARIATLERKAAAERPRQRI